MKAARREQKEPVQIFSMKTPYQTIGLNRMYDGSVALTLDKAIQFVSGLDEQMYHGVLAGRPAQMLDKPTDVLVLGGGDGLAARNLVEFPAVRSVTLCELDPGMIEFATFHPIMRKINKGVMGHPKMNILAKDARTFLEDTPHKFGLAVVDFPDPILPEHQGLYTKDFYEKLYGRMGGEPILSVQASIAGGPIERGVSNLLADVTQTPSYPLRYFGVWMGNGSAVVSGPGVKPSMTTIPWELRGEPERKKEVPYAGVF
jgi:predicted membrane-bound spermidine synthase